MKKLISLSLIGLSALLIAGCGSGGGGGGAPTPVCPGGTIFDPASNTCVATDPEIVPSSGPMKFYDYNKLFQYSWGGTQTYNGDMRITNRAAYKTFLKEAMAVCDRGTWVNYGMANCDDWVSGSFQLEVRIDSSLKPSVSFTAYPRFDLFNYNFQAGFDSGGWSFNPLNLSSGNTLSLINQSKGLEIRANGTYLNGGGSKLIQIIVRQGTLADSSLTYELFYPLNGQPTQVATGLLKRY